MISSKIFTSIYLVALSMFISISLFAQTKNVTSLKPGQTFKDCKECPEMVVIPAGSFTMGSPANEQDRRFYSDSDMLLEEPQRLVHIQKFAAGKFDITKGQWAEFVKATNRSTVGGCRWSGLPGEPGSKLWDPNPAASWKNLGFQQDDNHPVVCITWDDAKDYVQWLSKRTKANYRLLTEAEWEYAARAGTITAFPWGDSASHEHANYGVDTAAGVGFAFGRDKWVYTSPVGSFPPNQFGLYDMNGNVLQWVEDCFSASYDGLPTNGSAYTGNVQLKMPAEFASMNGKSSGSFRICRGGDCGDPPALIRSAARNWGPAPRGTLHDFGTSGLGFRVAKTL